MLKTENVKYGILWTYADEWEDADEDDGGGGDDEGDLPGFERTGATVPRTHAAVLPLLHLTPIVPANCNTMLV